MVTTIRIDDEVKRELENRANEYGLGVFSDPNDVLRIVFGLDSPPASKMKQASSDPIDPSQVDVFSDPSPTPRYSGSTRQKIGSKLLREHPHINARRGYFSKYLPAGNTPYQYPSEFPAVFFDPEGYFVVDSEESMRSSSYFRVGKQINVLGGISSIPGYIHCGHWHE